VSRLVVLVLSCAAVLGTAGPVGASAPSLVPAAQSEVRRSAGRPDPAAEVRRLRAQVKDTASELAGLTLSWEQGGKRLEQLQQQDLLAQRVVDEQRGSVAAAQSRMDALASLAYRQPASPELEAALTGDLRVLTDYLYVRRGLQRAGVDQQAVLQDLTAQRAQAQLAAVRQGGLRLQAQQLQRQLDGQLAAILDVAGRRQAELQRAAKVLDRAVAQRQAELARQALARVQRRDAAAQAAAARDAAVRAARAAGAGASAGLAGPGAPIGLPGGLVPSTADDSDALYVNGFIPDTLLQPLSSAPGHRLRPRPAAAFDAMSQAYAGSTGSPLCVTDSYRSYAAQVDLFRRKPSLAATPGTSNHGLGRAVDMCGGVESFGSPAHRWMQAHAGEFGWIHPSWAEPGGSRPEPWHWEYVGLALTPVG